ncbi:porin [Bradyrhizobium manausense]
MSTVRASSPQRITGGPPGIVGGSYGSNTLGGTRSPDLLASLRVDQAWGLFQASFAAHDNHVGYYGATELTGRPDDKWGWAAQLALSIKNIPTGAGDTINLHGVYTDGATRYDIQVVAPNSLSMYSGAGLAGAHRLCQRSGHRLHHRWLAAEHHDLGLPRWLHPQLGSLLEHGHLRCVCWRSLQRHQQGVHLRFRGHGCSLLVAGSTCNPDFNITQAGIITRWTPVKNLTFSGDFNWTRLDQKYSGAVLSPGFAPGAKPLPCTR